MLATVVVRAEWLALRGSSNGGAHHCANARRSCHSGQGVQQSRTDRWLLTLHSRAGLPEPSWDRPRKPRFGHFWHGGKHDAIEATRMQHTCNSTEQIDPYLCNLRQQGLDSSNASCSPKQRMCIHVDTVGAYCNLGTQLRSSRQPHCAVIQRSMACMRARFSLNS